MKIELPTDWSDVNLGQFMEIAKCKDQTDKIDFIVEVVSILSNTERQKIAQLDLANLTKAYNAISFINEVRFPEQIHKTILVQGKPYVAELDISKMNADQYMCLKGYTKDSINNLHYILSIFYVPKGKKWNEVNHRDVAELFASEVPITMVYPVAVFFCNLLKIWTESIQEFSSNRMKKAIMDL